MSFDDYKQKPAITVVYTGDGKGKTSASLGLTVRALGRGWSVVYVQFIKHWQVGEHTFIEKIMPIFENKLVLVKGGKGFYNAGDLSAEDTTDFEHKKAAEDTYAVALEAVKSGKYNLVVCDEINNAVHDGLLTKKQLKELFIQRKENVNLCITGRNFPDEFVDLADIVTDMRKVVHHFDDKYLANKGIDF